MATHFSILAEKSRRQRQLAGYSPWGHPKYSGTTSRLASAKALASSPGLGFEEIVLLHKFFGASFL